MAERKQVDWESVERDYSAGLLSLREIGGAASFVGRVRSGQAKYSNTIELIGELVVSAFAGLVTFFCVVLPILMGR